MARERRGFIVVQVWANIAYTDKDGQRQHFTHEAKASSKLKHKLTDTEKHKLKVQDAKRISRETIADLSARARQISRIRSSLAISRGLVTRMKRGNAAA